MTTRELRLWHWRQALRFRHLVGNHKTNGAATHRNAVARRNTTLANFHMSAVQALNELFPLGDCAEKDNL